MYSPERPDYLSLVLVARSLVGQGLWSGNGYGTVAYRALSVRDVFWMLGHPYPSSCPSAHLSHVPVAGGGGGRGQTGSIFLVLPPALELKVRTTSLVF